MRSTTYGTVEPARTLSMIWIVVKKTASPEPIPMICPVPQLSTTIIRSFLRTLCSSRMCWSTAVHAASRFEASITDNLTSPSTWRTISDEEDKSQTDSYNTWLWNGYGCKSSRWAGYESLVGRASDDRQPSAVSDNSWGSHGSSNYTLRVWRWLYARLHPCHHQPQIEE